MGSILKEFVIQYSKYINEINSSNLILVGGIPDKLPILLELFKFYYPDKTITVKSNECTTHLGMINYIKKFLWQKY